MVALVAEHLAGMHGNSPPGHVHALAIEGLRQPGVTFWSAWKGEALCGCGALKELDPGAGELKSMRTRNAFLRQGVGQAVLDEIVRTARARGYSSLFLETGTGEAFAAAHALYLRNGFKWCGRLRGDRFQRLHGQAPGGRMTAAPPRSSRMRIAIFGNSGSGKSTLANWLAESADLAVLDLDTVAWEPGPPDPRVLALLR